MSKSKNPNELEDTAASTAPEVAWETMGVAMPSDLRARFTAAARDRHLRPSQLARIILVEWLDRASSAATAA